jgi:hypothetical protein
MSAEPDLPEYSAEERRLLDALPRESLPDPHTEERVVRRLRGEGYLRLRSRRIALRAAAAVALFAGGGLTGGWYVQRGALESQLRRDDLTGAERILLLQRAGSAYVSAAEAYVTNEAAIDSSAVEVARQVLVGAARGVARADLETDLSPRLVAALETAAPAEPDPAPAVIWY